MYNYKPTIRRIVSRAIKAGYTVSVFDGEEFAIKRSTDIPAIVAACESTGEDTLVVRTADGTKVGSIWLVYGNLPEELVADYRGGRAIDALVI